MTKNTSKAMEHLKTAWRQIAEDGPDKVNRAAMSYIEEAIEALLNEPARGTETMGTGNGTSASDSGKTALATAGALAEGL